MGYLGNASTLQSLKYLYCNYAEMLTIPLARVEVAHCSDVYNTSRQEAIFVLVFGIYLPRGQFF